MGGLQMIQIQEDHFHFPPLVESQELPQVFLKQIGELQNGEISTHTVNSCWYQIVDESFEYSHVLCMKWTRPLVLGSLPSVAVIIKGEGLFELVGHFYASKFQDLGKLDDFSRSVTNFLQYKRHHRFWVTSSGQLRALVVSPTNALPHNLEWRDFCKEQSPDFWDMRMFGSKFGYFINNISTDEQKINSLEQIYNTRKVRKGSCEADRTNTIVSSCLGAVCRFMGMHLYRCWQCKRTLLKPLQCGKCKSVVYCNESCQKEHWPVHRQVCTADGVFF